MTNLFRGAILGAPGSGKGTVSTKIAQAFDIYHVSMGDVFRNSVHKGDEMGEELKKYVTKGKLVPDDLAIEITMRKLREVADKHWLLDGFPRTLPQAQKLFAKHPFHLVISLNVPFDIIIGRVKDRWIHPGSGRIYNTIYKPPKEPGKDDLTGERLIQRPDDNPQALLHRLETYTDLVNPLLEFYREKNVLKEFTGNTTQELWPMVKKEVAKFVKSKR